MKVSQVLQKRRTCIERSSRVEKVEEESEGMKMEIRWADAEKKVSEKEMFDLPSHVMWHPYQKCGCYNSNEWTIVNQVYHAIGELIGNKWSCCFITPLSKCVNPWLTFELDIRRRHLKVSFQNFEISKFQNYIGWKF